MIHYKATENILQTIGNENMLWTIGNEQQASNLPKTATKLEYNTVP